MWQQQLQDGYSYYGSSNNDDPTSLDLSDVVVAGGGVPANALYCPCPPDHSAASSGSMPWRDNDPYLYPRFLQESGGVNASATTTGNGTSGDDGGGGQLVVWEVAFTSVVLFLMFAALISDRMGADSVMITTLTAFVSRLVFAAFSPCFSTCRSDATSTL